MKTKDYLKTKVIFKIIEYPFFLPFPLKQYLCLCNYI